MSPAPPQPAPDPSEPSRAWTVAHIAAWVAVLATGVGAWLAEPISRTDSHTGRAMLALAAAGMAVVFVASGMHVRRPGTLGLRRVWRALAVLLAVLGVANYYVFDPDFATGLGDHTDPAYYYLNSKYFDELGYFGIYEAVLLCDAEGPNRVASHVHTVRNLRDYQLEPGAAALARAPEVKARFSAERWEAFCHDADWFVTRKSRRSLTGNFFVDHGYNPPPPWTLVGGQLNRLVPVEAVKLSALVDVGLCIGMFGVVWWALGPDVMLLAVLWWLCTMSGRWPVMGHSILRFDWVAAIVLGFAALHKGRPALGGIALVWTALSRIFPAVYWCLGALGFAAQAVRDRAISRDAWRYLGASVAFGLLVAGLSLADVGVEGFKGSLHNLQMHNDDPEAYSSQKVGLADAIFFRGETTRDEMRDSPCGFVEHTLAGVDCTIHGDAAKGQLLGNGIAGKGVLVHGIKPWLKGVAVGVLAFLVLYAWRTRARPDQLVHLGTLLIFILTTPSHYYYTMRIVLVLFHAADLTKRRNQVGLLLLFAVEILTNWAMTQGWQKYTVTATMSWSLLVYFTWLLVVMALELRRPRD